MNKVDIKGIIPAFITPFKADGSLNAEAAKAHAQRLIDKGANSLYVGGSSGEMILLSTEERKELLEAVMTAVPENFPIIAHIGAANPADAYELARHAEKAGAAAISSVAPFYYKYNFKEIKAYYEKIGSICDLPMIVYNIPALSGANLSIPQIKELLALDCVGGMKFTCSDFYAFERVRYDFPDKLLYNGSDEIILSGLAMGADGGIGTTYNVLVSKFAELYKLFKANKMAEALEMQHQINSAIEQILSFNLLPAIKALVKACGLDCGTCRDPFETLPAEQEAALIEAVRGKLSWEI